MERRGEMEKPACRFGPKCYRKNPGHFLAYSHPSDINKCGAKVKTKNKEAGRCKDDQNKASKSPSIGNEKNEKIPFDFIGDENKVFNIIEMLFQVKMPPDFYSFYEFYKNFKETHSFESCGLKLVGPFDVLSGKIQHLIEPEISLLHWRFYYDPPEFQTVLVSDSEYHIGYWRDDPNELPIGLASNAPDKDCTFKMEGENIFVCVLNYLKVLVNSCDPFKKIKIKKLELALCKWAEKNKIPLKNNSKSLLLREKKIVSKTFHKMGLVVPIEEKTGIGYRPLMETEEKLRKICYNIILADENERECLWESLQPFITAANIANDECDFGNSLELGIDLFCMGSHIFHEAVEHLLSTAYSLLNRTAFEKIIKAHLRNRKKGKNLSVLQDIFHLESHTPVMKF